MPLYLIAFAVVIVLLFALAAIQATMRGQVHRAMYGQGDVKPMDVRYTNDLLGSSGIWNLHKRAYQHSQLRYLFWWVLGGCLVCLVLGVFDFLRVRP